LKLTFDDWLAGGGPTLIEVQQNSDTTYQLYVETAPGSDVPLAYPGAGGSPFHNADRS
jgi:hypothetical protein